MLAWAVALLMSSSTPCDSVATATLQLEGIQAPFCDTSAYYMSCGPRGAALTQAAAHESEYAGKRHYLRLMFHSVERSSWISVEDIVELDRGMLKVIAEYSLNFADIAPLERRTVGCGRYRTVRAEPDIVWVNARIFELRREDTVVVVEHLGGSQFKVTVRARTGG